MKRLDVRESFERFFTRVPGECWNFRGRAIEQQKAQFQFQGERHHASIWAWMIYRGEIPEDQFVLHRCDNFQCVNYEEHLWLGSLSENTQDSVRKNRWTPANNGFKTHPPVGEKHFKAKVTSEVVRRIRIDTRPNTLIAREVGLSPGQVGKIKRFENWSHL